MAKLAIKGHKTRGKEVIEILEMLGGINKFKLRGNEYEWFVLNENLIQRTDRLFTEKGFTLEEFLEKFPYKVGDKVSSKYLKNYRIEKMEWEDTNNRVIYKLQGIGWYSAKELQPYKEETMEDKINEGMENGIIYDEIDFNRCPAADKVLLILGDNYEIKEENGNYYAVRKKPQYPKTYEECRNILEHIELDYIAGYKCNLLESFQELLVYRDAYWKIAGEEMGLGKPWEPDWTKANERKYCIVNTEGNITKWIQKTTNKILAFPTEEMRDAFKENFDKDLETCKELL